MAKKHHQGKLQVITTMGSSTAFVLVGVRKTPPAQVAEVEGRSGCSNQMRVVQGEYQGKGCALACASCIKLLKREMQA